MKTIYSNISKRMVSFFVAVVMAISTVPFAAASAFAAERERISIVTNTITPNTKEIVVNLGQSGTVGFVKILQLDSGESYSSKLFDANAALSEIVGYAGLQAGENTIALTGTPTVGKEVVAVLRDASGKIEDYVSDAVTVTASDGTSGGETTKPTEAEILAGCEVTIDEFTDGKITEDATSLTAHVKLHSSVESCYMKVVAYPANAAFDPDNGSVTKTLFTQQVKDGETYTCNFTESNLPLQVGQKVCAYLNVPVSEDREGDYNYRQKQSRELEVVDKDGNGFKDYTWPEVHITDTDLKAGDTKLHITFSADDRLLAYAKDESLKFGMTISIQQYPKDEKFDLDAPTYMRSLVSPMNMTENLENYEVTLKEPLRAGYRVRAIVYWDQNADLYIPKGNDYEAAGIPDDSVLIPAEAVAPTVKINADKIKAGAESVTVAAEGDIPEGSVVIVRQYKTNDTTNLAGVFGSYPNAVAGNLTVTKHSAIGKDLEKGNYVGAVLISGGEEIASSNIVPIVGADEVEKPILTVNGNVYEGDTKVSLAVSNTDLIPEGKGMITLYKADADGKVDVYGEPVSVGSKSPVVSGDAVEISVTKALTAGDMIVPYIYYVDDADETHYYPGTAFTVKAKTEGDNISVSPETLTADTESIAVSVNGYDSYKDGYVFAKLVNSSTADADSGTSLGSKPFTGTGSYTFDVKGKLTPQKYVLVYLYKYDSDTDKTDYSDNIYIPVGGKIVKESVVEITTPNISSTDKSVYVKADFDSELTGKLRLYTYSYSGAFDSTNEGNVLLYEGSVAPSASGSKITFTDDLTTGNKLVAVLTLTGGESDVVKVSDAKTIQAPPQIATPTAYINEKHVSEGDTKMTTYLNFEKSYYDTVSYVLYNYKGDELDESTAKVVSEKEIYIPGSETMGFKADARPLEAGSKLVIKLTLVKKGVATVVYSNVKEVEAAPDWATPTVSIDVAAVRVTDTTIPVTVTYDKGYTEMDEYYCNVTAYQFPSVYTDDEFEEKELHESTTITQRIGQCDADKDNKEHFTTIQIPVKNTLEAGKRLIVKLRLPHPEWAGEEADYLSYSVPVIGADEEIPVAKVLLFNLGEDTVKGSKIRAILQEMGIEAITVEKSQINQSVGYLAGMKGFTGDAEEFTGDGYTTDFMLMSSLSETQMDQFLAKMRAADAVIDHKAVVTETNKQWSFKQLIGEIEEEHEVMQAWIALSNAIKEAEKLKEAEYDAEDWAAFAKVLQHAKDVSQVENTAKDYNDTTKELKDAYRTLTGVSLEKFTVKVEGSTAETTGAGTYRAGETVSVSTGSKGGYRFLGWQADGVTLADANALETTFVMPENDVTITAQWKKKKSSSTSGSGSKKDETKADESKNNEESKDENKNDGKNSTEEPAKTIVTMQIGSKHISVNGAVSEKDAAPVIRNDRTLVPIRFVTESLGGTVAWNGEIREVVLTIDGREIRMTIGKTLENYGVAPVIIDSRTFVPIRFVADTLGAETAWEDATKTVTVTK